MFRYFINLKYKGSRFHGWQIQENAISVQAELETALATIFQKEIAVTGAGRTDTGVHATQMTAHFDLDEKIVNMDFIYRINSLLNHDISIDSLREVKTDFHARFDAINRTYHYQIHQKKNPFLEEFSYRYGQDLDLEKMNQACKDLIVKADFSCFSKSHTQTLTNDCEIFKAEWNKQDDILIFEIKANRFLRNMVRAIVGTLLEIGEGKRPVDAIPALIESKDRSLAGTSVPAHGLYLSQVEYPETGFI